MLRIVLAGLLAISLAACSAVPGLAPGLVARMDAPGATLDRPTALAILNAFRATRNAPALVPDAALDNRADALAAAYAKAGAAPKPPEGMAAMMTSAGYLTFADTFSGWRGTEKDAATLALAKAKKAGLGVIYDAASAYGVYWVLLLAPATN